LAANLGRRLRRNEVVLKLQNLRHVSNRISGLRIDGHAQKVVSGTVDEVAVGIELEVAPTRIVGHAAEHRHVVDNAGRLLHIEEAGAADRHIGAHAGRRDGSLRGDRSLRVGPDAARRLLVRRRAERNEIFEAGVGALVANGRRIRDVAGNVLERE